jgi:hypothetical protein
MPWSIAFMVVAIVLITSIARVAKERHRAEVRQGTPGLDSADAMRMREEMNRLKQRVQVLERVITDNRGSMDLDGEIERLRDR